MAGSPGLGTCDHCGKAGLETYTESRDVFLDRDRFGEPVKATSSPTVVSCEPPCPEALAAS